MAWTSTTTLHWRSQMMFHDLYHVCKTLL